MTLANAPVGVPLRLGEIRLSGPHRLRLAELGLRPGCRVTVLRRTAGGGRIIGVGDARVALGNGVLASVPVRPAGGRS